VARVLCSGLLSCQADVNATKDLEQAVTIDRRTHDLWTVLATTRSVFVQSINVEPRQQGALGLARKLASVRLLIVEDDLRLCNVLQRGLREQGHVVDQAHDGEEGEHFAGSGSYDALIVDINMPVRDGLSLVSSLRQTGSETPVLILTSRDTAADVIEGLDAGADDYLRKPFVFAELEARLRALTRRKVARIATTRLQVADLIFEYSTRETRRGNRSVALTAREIGFLEYFMRNANRVVTRRMLEDAMFDRESKVVSNVIDVYVSRLRSKIATNGERQLLHTVRGIGYRLGEA
jgi:two-component system OmpR family response regulator